MKLMGIDIGTTGCKAAVFDRTGNTLIIAYREYDVIRAEPGQAELNNLEIWTKVCECITECAMLHPDIAALSTTSMGEAMVPVDHAGNICGNAVLGADSRGLKFLPPLFQQISRDQIYRITGQPPGAGYSLPALCRIRYEEPELYQKTAKFYPWADFVTWMLCGVGMANASLAARTLLCDRHQGCWSKPIAGAAGFDLTKLPPVAPPGQLAGVIKPEIARRLKLKDGVKIVNGSHDQCAATLGAGVCQTGTAMLGLGTYACMVLPHGETDTNSPFARLKLNEEPHVLPGELVSFVYHGSGGALLKWLRQTMFADCTYPEMDAQLQNSKMTATVLPYFAETGPLDNAPGGQGVIANLSLASTRADILKGAMAGIVFYFREAVEKLTPGGSVAVTRIYVTGGGANSAVWRQMIADILQIEVVTSKSKECGALGAAMIAGAGGGVFADLPQAVAAMSQTDSVHRPDANCRADWDAAYAQYVKLKGDWIKR